jgi:serine/threonine-protein kinase
MQLSPNTRLGRYDIRSLLGKGGMGEVYLAQDANLKRLVAIKLLPAEFTEDPARLRRFEREAYAASSLNHPNILTIYEIGDADAHRFIASEYVEGKSLRQHLSRRRMELKEILDTAIQITSALNAAHREGIVHRDIKPENVMLRSDGYVKVLDFGLAKLVHTKATGHRPNVDREALTFTMTETSPGIVMGTISYMSPEQARGREIDGSSDIWSLGVMLYEMIAGTAPFRGETSNDVVAAILKTEPEPRTEFPPTTPPELTNIVSKMLQKKREDRYQNCTDLLADLEDLKQELQFVAKMDRTVPYSLLGKEQSAESKEAPVQFEARETVSPSAPHRTSRLDSFVDGIRRHKLATVLFFGALVAGLGAAAYFRYPFPGTEAINSIAVLPFVNGSGDQALDYLADGLSENLIDRLSQLPQLRVINRSSSFKFRSPDPDPQDVAKTLGVQALVMGRLVKRGDDLQVRVELVDGRDKTQVWGGQYNGKADDLQGIQAEISRTLSEKLRPKSGSEHPNVDKSTTDEAYQLYLKGRYSWNKLTEEELKKSIQFFNQAIEKNPNYALAYAGLANSYLTLGTNDLPPEETYPKAEAAAKKALSLDDTLAEAHYAVAATKYFYYWNLADSEKELSRALELNPNYALAYNLRSSLRLTKGQTNEAIVQVKRALDLDPFSLLFNNKLSTIQYYARDHNAALEQIRKTLEIEAQASFLYSDMCMNYAQLGRYDDALAACQKAIILQKDDPAALTTLGITYALWGKKADAEWILDSLNQLAKRKYIPPYYFASIYAVLGDKDQSIGWLEKGKRERSFLMLVSFDPAFDKIRSDPRYTALIESMQVK